MHLGRKMRRITDNIYLLWALLSLPAIWLIIARFVLHVPTPYVHWTGLISCWLLIVTMMITPLQFVFGPLPWLRKRRRYFGVASFGYAALHLLVWMVNLNIGKFLRSFTRIELLTGWISLFLMVALAVTSNEMAVRGMGTGWKRLQRWIYPAAILAFVHWLMTTGNRVEAILYCAPLIALSVWRVARYRSRLSGI